MKCDKYLHIYGTKGGITVEEIELFGIWIPCSERLPDEKGEYLVAYHPCYWDDVKAEVKVGIDSFCGKTSWAKRKYQRVIAWMPLPPSYKGELRGEHDG